MKVNIYYGGRGLIDDPTIYVMDKLTEVLEEIRVEVTRYNLYEEKNSIAMLPSTLKEADGVILATTVEWLGIGGLMAQFLDACWLYGDKECISQLYMMPIVMANTYGEKEAEVTLSRSWEILGGTACNGLSAYVEDHVEFETNTEYASIIEKKAEDLYRIIHQKAKFLPSSTTKIKQGIVRSTLDLTPQESEQLSVYVSDDAYVKKQKEDIEELTQMFQGMLGTTEKSTSPEFVQEFKDAFQPKQGVRATFAMKMTDVDKTLVLEVQNEVLNCYYGIKEDADVEVKTTKDVVGKIAEGHMTFQRAFMSGILTAKGNFMTIKSFDEIFHF